jgi:TM2 domain-containing membrane protein YozV
MAIAALIINFFFPGIGTLMVGKVIPGIMQLIMTLVGIILNFTIIGAIVGIPLCLAAWIWGLISAGTAVQKALRDHNP